ncbi:hypothetical protein J6590_078417 [Homalodisca vitripennis]|nr:hypothetical protein J6590_078417 [Homalodisca vitripennis]
MNESGKKRRSKGEGRECDERKKLRNSGQEYTTKNNTLVAAKTPPPENVQCHITVKPVQRRRHGDYNDPKQSRRQANLKKRTCLKT